MSASNHPVSFWQTLTKPVIGLSPMDGVTDAAFRFIAAKHGPPDVAVTEFVNVEAAVYTPLTMIRDLSYSEIERPVVAQIYGHTPELFYKVAHLVCELGFDGLDINMGCPAKKVAARGSGAALILTPDLARSIIQAAAAGIRDWCDGQRLCDLNMDPELIRQAEAANRERSGPSCAPERRPIPVSVKTRIGYDRIVVEEWIRTLLEEKPAAISIHGRTLKQGYKGNADWSAIARAVETVKGSGTWVLGNGDLQDMNDVYRRVRETGVDGVLIGRSAQGNPWIFRAKEQVRQAVRAKDPLVIRQEPPDLAERFEVMLEHTRLFERSRGSQKFVGMRKHLLWYCHGLRHAAELRSRLVRTNSMSEVVACLDDYSNYKDENGNRKAEMANLAASQSFSLPDGG